MAPMVQAAFAFCSRQKTTAISRIGLPRELLSSPNGMTLSQIAGPTVPGLRWQIYPGTWTELPDLAAQTPVFKGDSPSLQADPQGFTRYAAVWDGFIDIPADGGYTFHLMARDGARLVIDGMQIAQTGPPFAQVCGSPGNAVRYDHGSVGLRAGPHASAYRRSSLRQPGIAAHPLGRPVASSYRHPSHGLYPSAR